MTEDTIGKGTETTEQQLSCSFPRSARFQFSCDIYHTRSNITKLQKGPQDKIDGRMKHDHDVTWQSTR